MSDAFFEFYVCGEFVYNREHPHRCVGRVKDCIANWDTVNRMYSGAIYEFEFFPMEDANMVMSDYTPKPVETSLIEVGERAIKV